MPLGTSEVPLRHINIEFNTSIPFNIVQIVKTVFAKQKILEKDDTGLNIVITPLNKNFCYNFVIAGNKIPKPYQTLVSVSTADNRQFLYEPASVRKSFD